MKKILSIVCVSLTVAVFAACNVDSGSDQTLGASNVMSDDGALTSANLGAIPRVSELKARVGSFSALDDSPANTAMAAVIRAFENGDSSDFAFNVYSLAPLPDAAEQLRARASSLGIGYSQPTQAKNALFIRQDALELRMNINSGTEFFVDKDLFHKGASVDSILSETDYFSKASSYIEKAIPGAFQQGVYAYKFARYMNATAEKGDDTPQTGTYQVAVAFNTTIDDIPVIGPGGKISIHMTPDGKVISHESSLKPVQKVIGTLAGNDLLSPREAQQMVEEKLTRNGADLRNYKLVRSEFGYFRYGRDNIQNIVAPHYAFVFEPVNDEMSKRLVEFLPAVETGDLAKAIFEDMNLDLQRKQAAADLTDPETPR